MAQNAVSAATRMIALPDGDTVEISLKPIEQWMQKNASFYVDPHMIAPDPKNPRRDMNELRLKELYESIKARGVRQELTVTPLQFAPWVEVDPQYRDCFFSAVSGHRRRAGALLGDIKAVPVKVKIYPSEKEHRLDMSLLNKGQDDLTDLEEGYEMVDLQKLGWKIEQLSTFFGYSVPHLYTRMNLTKLHPDLQKLLDESLPREKRLTTTVGGTLGGVKPPDQDELDDLFESFDEIIVPAEVIGERKISSLEGEEPRFALQKLLFLVIKKRGLPTDRAVEFIRDRTLSLKAHNGASGKKTERYQPQRRKDIILNLVREVEASVVVDWKPEELNRIFELSSYEEVEEYIKRMDKGRQVFDGIITALERIKKGKRPTHPEALKYLSRDKAKVTAPV